MTNTIDLNKTVFDKNLYTITIDNKFKELGVNSVVDDLSNVISVETFFDNYNSIFYSIPKTGNSNSHEYLVKTSGDYINFEQTNEQILALQQEISNLRTENLSQSMQILELQTGQSLNLTGSFQ